MDLSAHFLPVEDGGKERRYTATLPAHVDDKNLAPVLETPKQLFLGREDGGSYPDADDAWEALSQTAAATGFALTPNRERSFEDASGFFFDLEGEGAFDPQAFVDRFAIDLYGA